MMWLLTAWGGVKKLFGLALRYPLQAAIVALLCLSAWLYMGKAGALATVAKRDDTIVAMTKASKDARAAQIAMNAVRTSKETQIAKDADNDQTIRRDIADRSSRYAERMSAENYCRKASAASENRITETDTSAGPNAVVLTPDDFRILTDNTARLVEVRAWGQSLVDEGLGVPVD